MKIHPFLKSLIVIILVNCFLFLFEDFTSLNSSNISELILAYLLISLVISILFSVPFYFWKKIKKRKLLFLIISCSAFLFAFCIITIESGYPYNYLNRYYLRLMYFIGHYFNLTIKVREFAPIILLPFTLYFPVKLFSNANWKLLGLLFFTFPLIVFLETYVPKGFLKDSGIVLIFLLNLVSNIYLIFFHKDQIEKPDINILDSPNL